MPDMMTILARLQRRSLIRSGCAFLIILVICWFSGVSLWQPILLLPAASAIWDTVWWRRKRELAVLVPVEDCLALELEEDRQATIPKEPAETLTAIGMAGLGIHMLWGGLQDGEVSAAWLVTSGKPLAVASNAFGYWLWMLLWTLFLTAVLYAVVKKVFPRLSGAPKSFDGYWVQCDGFTFKP